MWKIVLLIAFIVAEIIVIAHQIIYQDAMLSLSGLPPSAIPSIPSPVQVPKYFPDPNIKYLPNGDFDMSEWGTYRSDYSGFLIRSPYKASVHVRNESDLIADMRSDAFSYRFSPLLTITAELIKKEKDDTLENWITRHVDLHPEHIQKMEFISIGKYHALQFDTDDQDWMVGINSICSRGCSPLSPGQGRVLPKRTRFIIIDGGQPDRYAFAEFPLPSPSESHYLNVYYTILSTLEFF